MLSNLRIISSCGEILVDEKYRNDVKEEDLKALTSTILRSKSYHTPYHVFNQIYGYSIKREKITYLAVSKKFIQTIVVIQFLENFHSLIRSFSGCATEDHIRKNLLLIYEIMTECLDNGFIKTTSVEQIRHKIYSDPADIKLNHKCEIKKPGPFGLEKVFIPNSAAERPLVKFKSQQNTKSEVFVDVIEKLTAHFSKEGLCQKFCLYGVIQLKSFITIGHRIFINYGDSFKQEGMLKGLTFSELQFDSCVDHDNFEKQRLFIVTPSQGEVKVMTYCMNSAAILPFRLISNIQDSENIRDCDLTLKLMCNLPSDVEAVNLILHIPISSCTRNVMQQFNMYDNSAEFIQKERKILWKLKKLPGQGEVIAKFKLIEALQVSANLQEIGPVSIEFEISNTCGSGLGIKNIKAEDHAGKIIPIQKWVRYVTLAQSYIFSI